MFLQHKITSLEDGADYFLPMVNRRWLQLLDHDPISGFRIRPSLSLPADELGFSFNSNSLGLRGPELVSADKVLFGTSYAMGFAVNNGENWWDLTLNDDWINLSLPVGVNRIRQLYESIYCGKRKLAVVLYHPNFWQYAKQYLAQSTSGKSVSEYFGWQVDEEFCRLLQVKTLRLREAKVANGQAIAFVENDIPHYMESEIYRFDFERERDVVEMALEHWCELLSEFDRVVVIRGRMKQELCPDQHRTSKLEVTCAEFDKGWQIFLSGLSPRVDNLEAYESSCIGYEHFYPAEGHWTANGNKAFASWFSDLNL